MKQICFETLQANCRHQQEQTTCKHFMTLGKCTKETCPIWKELGDVYGSQDFLNDMGEVYMDEHARLF